MSAAPLFPFRRVVPILALAAFVATPAFAGDPQASGVSAKDLLHTSTWGNGVPLTYPTGTPEITSKVIEIAPGGDTGVHVHDTPLYAYILEGELTVDIADGTTKTFKAGDALMEVSIAHHGHNDGKVPVKLLAVYIGAKGVPLSRAP